MNAPEVRVGDRPVNDEVPGLVIVVERVVVEVVPCGGLDLVAEPGDECGRGRVPEGEGHVGGVRKAFPPQNPRPLEGIGRLTAEATAIALYDGVKVWSREICDDRAFAVGQAGGAFAIGPIDVLFFCMMGMERLQILRSHWHR